MLSLVFYTGERAWKAPSSLLELVETLPGAPEGLDLWSYFLIDGQRYSLTDLIDSQSPLLGLFRLEQLGAVEDLPVVTQELAKSLGSENQELAAA